MSVGSRTSTQPMTWPVASAALIALAVTCAFALFVLDGLGRSSRVPADNAAVHQLIVAANGPEAIARLEQTGMKGAYLIQLGTESAFTTIDFSSSVPTEPVRPGSVYPFYLVDVQRYYVESLRPDNYMLVAARTGIARKVDHVVSPGLFENIRETALNESNPDITVTGDAVRVNLQGEVRHILPRLPRTEERFSLLVNASYFSQTAPEELVEALRPFVSQVDYVAVTEDQNDPAVDAAARRRAAQFVDMAVGVLK